MDVNAYTANLLAQSYLAELRASAQRHHLARAAARPRRPLRLALGHALVRIGHRLLDGYTPVRASV